LDDLRRRDRRDCACRGGHHLLPAEALLARRRTARDPVRSRSSRPAERRARQEPGGGRRACLPGRA
jgi:hypothetical protein